MRAFANGLMALIAALSLPASAAAEDVMPVPMVAIAGGDYPIGSDEGGPSAQPPHRVRLKPFLIDTHEVTNAHYSAFLNEALDVIFAGELRPGELDPEVTEGPDADRVWGGSGGNDRAFIELDDSDARIGITEGRFTPVPGFAEHPVSETTWRGAAAYCAWRGARLPTEAEWEAAARGVEGRTYPWGAAAPTPEHAVYGRPSGATDPVGSHPRGATPEGVFDLAGNAAEWTSSLFRPYPYDATDGREDLASDAERVTRGGDHVFDVTPEKLTGFFRDGYSRNPRRGHRHIGFRCARDAG